METFFDPKSIAILGLSSRPDNVARLILENLIRWGFRGRIFGVNPNGDDIHVNGVKMFRKVSDLPQVPDIAVALMRAKYVPETVEACGAFGIRRMALPSAGFNELGAEGEKLAAEIRSVARKYNVRIVGPNALTVANVHTGLCLPFVSVNKPARGGLSLISQSGGLGLFLWNLLKNENLGLAKFVSIGNKLDLNEVDFLEYFAILFQNHRQKYGLKI